jgi:hypothetical protein
MIIVHVAIISGCLLASNNPSATVALISNRVLEIARPPTLFFLHAVYDLCFQPVYDSCFQPANMWERGANKNKWLMAIAPSFRKHMTIRWWEWVFYILLPTFVLVSVPPASAAFVAWRSPPVGWGCRSLSFICYGACQTIVMFIFFADLITAKGTPTVRRRIFLRIVYGVFCFLSLFSSLGSTIMQITGVFDNCICQVNANEWINRRNSMINVAMDTEADRNSSGSWIRIGIAATAFMAICAYVGWWYQKAITEKYEMAVEGLPGKASE